MKGFLFDLNRCTGCHACELACSTENELGWGRSWRQVVPSNPEHRPFAASFHLSMACNHCTDAPCLRQCPALAITREEPAGTVQIHADLCMGCRYCSWVCPYDAPRFDRDAGVMGKCTLCSHRPAGDRSPACVEGCPTSALGYGELLGDEQAPGFPEAPAGPSIRFTPLSQGTKPPESTWSVPPEVLASFQARRPAPSPITLASEWPLLAFSLVVAAMAGWVLAAVSGGVSPPLPVFLAAVLTAASVSSLHLGRPSRAWRAMLNVRGSWLSREVAAFALFASVTAVWLSGSVAGSGLHSWLGYLAAGAGLLSLFSIDRVYDPVRTGRPVHSADTLLTGPLLAATLLQALPAALLLAGLKGVLFLARRGGVNTPPRRRHPGGATAAGARVGVGLLLPSVLWIAYPEQSPIWSILPLAMGEIIDRAWFYGELEPLSPHRNMAELALSTHISGDHAS